VCHDTAHAQAFAIVSCDVDRQVTGTDEINRIGGLTFTIKDLRAIDVPSLEIAGEVFGPDTRTKLVLEPQFEVTEIRLGIDACLREQSILAPGQREIEVGENLVLALAAEEAGALEGSPVGM
jgi:hypothetical protein